MIKLVALLDSSSYDTLFGKFKNGTVILRNNINAFLPPIYLSQTTNLFTVLASIVFLPKHESPIVFPLTKAIEAEK